MFDKIHTSVPLEVASGANPLMDEMRTRAYEIAMSAERVEKLLGIARDTKTKKSLDKLGVLTGVLYLAPGAVSGHEMCHARTRGCSKDCLFTAGHGTYTQIKIGRLRKTYQFIYRQHEFLNQLNVEIKALARKAERKGNVPAVRLNGTSDVPWELYPVGTHANLFRANPDMQFYDYTKLFSRLRACSDIPNYHLTFSYAETKANRLHAGEALELGYNVAVVFDELPDTYLGHDVIDGDRTDVRFWDVHKQPVIVGLTAKGAARKDHETGFVVRLP